MYKDTIYILNHLGITYETKHARVFINDYALLHTLKNNKWKPVVHTRPLLWSLASYLSFIWD